VSHELSWASDVFFKSVWGKTTVLPLRGCSKVLVGAQGAGAGCFAKFGSQDRVERYVVFVQVGFCLVWGGGQREGERDSEKERERAECC
jgi:hypothetical protein